MAAKTASQLPSVQSLFQDSWVLFKKTWTTYLKLIGIGIAFLFLGALIGILIALPVSFYAVGSHFEVFQHMTPFHIVTLVLLVLWAIGYLLSIIAIAVLFPIASIFILQGKKASIIDLIKQAKKLFWPYFFTSLLVGLLTAGGIMLLILPGLVIGIFFIFAAYEVVLEKQSGVAALKRSYFMVKSDFWQIFGRILLVEVCVWIVNAIVSRITRGDILLGIAQVVVSILLTWYLRSYVFLLYKQVRERVKFPQQISFTWIWVVSVVGWVIILLLLVGLSAGLAHLPWGQPNHLHLNQRGAV